jgi:hypothetical protein
MEDVYISPLDCTIAFLTKNPPSGGLLKLALSFFRALLIFLFGDERFEKGKSRGAALRTLDAFENVHGFFHRIIVIRVDRE